MNIEELANTWNRFLREYYSTRPRLYELLKKASFVETEDGCELRIPVNSGQEVWLAEKGLGDIKSRLNDSAPAYSSLFPVHLMFLRQDGTVVKAEEKTPPPQRNMRPVITIPSISKSPSEREIPQITRTPIREELRCSEKIHRFADSISYVKSGGKRYTSPLLGWIALPIHLVGSIVSLFDKK